MSKFRNFMQTAERRAAAAEEQRQISSDMYDVDYAAIDAATERSAFSLQHAAAGVRWVGSVASSMFALSAGRTEQQREERKVKVLGKHRAHADLLEHKALIGAQGHTLSRYFIDNNLANRFQVSVGWYLNEAHHDALGADPTMISIFIVCFLARFIYANAVEAFLFGLLITIFDSTVWFLARALWPVVAKGLDSTESIWLTFVYNIFTSLTAVAVGSYALSLWPGIDSMAAIVGPSSDSYFLWADGVNSRIVVVIVYLLLFGFFSAFPQLYTLCLTAFALSSPLAVAVLRYDKHEPLQLYNSLLFASLSVVYFYACAARPIGGSYVWNMLLSISWYLFVISILVGFGFA